jgi:hypothetical protein
LSCEIVVVGDTSSASRFLQTVPNVRLLDISGSRLRVQIQGDAGNASALLRQMVSADIPVVRFDPREPALEQRYEETFGGRR